MIGQNQKTLGDRKVILREKGLLLSVKKLPGTHRIRQQARKLKCHNVIGDKWIVWGGRKQHEVIRDGNHFTCDCGIESPTNICTHILRVQIELGMFQ